MAKHLEKKLVTIQETAEILMKYPNIQARYILHKLSLNQQINYCMRTHFPQHSQPLVEGFIRSQRKLICSYHAIKYEEQYHGHT